MTFASNPVIQRLRQEREAEEQSATVKAAELWAKMDKNQKTAVRFGMFPSEIMEEADAAGFDTHEVCCAQMECATKDGGMRA